MSETPRILFVDDELNILRALERVFIEDDYEILTATSGEEALELMERVPPVQVVVSDFRMPHMNGVDLLREIRGKWPEAVRAVLSGYADTAAIVSAINEGQIYRFIPKPWNDSDLRMTIAAAVEQHRRQSKEILFANFLQKRIDELERENSFLVRRVAEAEQGPSAWDLADALPVGVLVFNAEGSVVLCNAEAASLLGIVGDPLAGMIDSRLPDELRALMEKREAMGSGAARISPAGTPLVALAAFRETSTGESQVVVALWRERNDG